jgi:hypothetical protein
MRSKKRRAKAGRDIRWQLMKVLSGGSRPACVRCGKSFFPHLEIDHVDAITWDRYTMNSYDRARYYVFEYVCGVRLQILCGDCNLKKGRGP